MWSGEGRCVQGFGGGNPREREHFDVLDVNGKIILHWIFKMWDVGMDLIDLAQDWDTWQVLVNFRGP